MTPTPKPSDEYYQGVKDGIRAHAIISNGELLVGALRKPIATVYAEVDAYQFDGDDKFRIEAMTTATLLGDAQDQALIAKGLDEGQERLLRAAGSVVAGIFVALGPAVRMTPIEAWRKHIQYTNESRERR